jgi:transposase-like protein
MMKDEGIFMSKKGQLGFETVSEFLRGKLSRKEASELLGVRERTISRMARRIETRGILGFVHGNRSRCPTNKKPEQFKLSVMKLVKQTYFDFNMTHCLEKLAEDHGIEVKYETFRRWCHEHHHVKRSKRRKPIARMRRARMPNEGLLLQLDGSPHRYNGKDEWCLIAAIDDATSDIPHAEFFPSEDTLSCMTVLQRIIEQKGIPYAIYVDKAGWLAGAKRQNFSQFKRACDELGIRVIAAHSPEAKGRIERAWDTFQDRLIPEMRLRKIHRMPTANDYLQTQFLPNYWKQNNTVLPRSPESRYSPLSTAHNLRETLCIKDYRAIKQDHTIQWDGALYQLESPVKYSIYRQKIEIRTYQDLKWQAFYAGRPISLTPVDIPQKLKLAA